jgi:hypothetical protein
MPGNKGKLGIAGPAMSQMFTEGNGPEIKHL